MGHCAGSGVAAPWYINGAGQAGSVGPSVTDVPGSDDAKRCCRGSDEVDGGTNHTDRSGCNKFHRRHQQYPEGSKATDLCAPSLR
jgi:hypothetical protein